MDSVPQCRICGSLQLVPVAELPYLYLPGLCHFLECSSCGTVSDSGIYRYGFGIGGNAQYTRADIKFYIEYLAGPGAFADSILGLKQLADSRHIARPRLLDVGTAFGFAVAVAQSLGWDAIGVEPSLFGEYGRKYLKVPILATYLENAALDKASFDFILIDDVIEHVTDPVAFVGVIASFLKPTGLLYITTPNSQVVTEHLEPDPVDVLSPGFHLNILSPTSLSQALRKNGFRGELQQVFGGVSNRMRLVSLSALQEDSLPESMPRSAQDVTKFVNTYLENLAAEIGDADPHNLLYGGTLYHLLEACVNTNDFAGAEIYEAKLLKVIRAQGWRERNLAGLQNADFAGYLNRVPAYLGMFYYYHGVLHQRHRLNYAEAAHAFEIAHHLFLIEQRTRIFPRGGWPERALEQKALALKNVRPKSIADRVRGLFSFLTQRPP